MADANAETPFEEFQEELTGPWKKLRVFWRDRRRILADPRIPASAKPALKNKPYSFAMQSLIVVPLVFGLGAPVVKFLFELPPTPAEREIGRYQTAATWTEAVLDDGTRWPPLPKDLPSELGGDLQVLVRGPRTPQADSAVTTLRDDLKRVIGERRAAAKSSEALESLRMVIVGIGFLINSYFFRYLVLRMRPTATRGERSHAFHLYYVGALLFWPTTFLSAAIQAASLADRLAGEALLWPTFLALALTGLWGLLLLRGRSSELALAFPPADDANLTRWGNSLLNRLAVSNFVTNIVLNVLTGLLLVALIKAALLRSP